MAEIESVSGPYEARHSRKDETMSESLRSTPWDARHTSVQHFQHLFAYDHLGDTLQLVSRPFAELAEKLLDVLRDGPELTVALRKLLEAKDAAVRQGVLDSRG